MKYSAEKLSEISRQARRLIIEVANKSRTAHVGSSLSCVDILVSLYFHVLDIDDSSWEERDIFVLSKAHAAMALYAVLRLKGFMDEETFMGYFQNNGTLPAHLDRFTVRGVEVSTGSLGHGFNMALGLAYGLKLKGDNRKVFVLIGDGESEEGSIWEGALFASKLGINNITAILDYNNLQGYGRPRDICHYEPVEDKWNAFGWETCRIDGHDFNSIISACSRKMSEKPRMIIAKTIKGKGVSFMEDELKWHYFIVTDELKRRALKELG
jgi:transketolase